MFLKNLTDSQIRIYIEELKENVDHFFLLTNAIFVCLMQCGFACLEAGSVRSKNVTNIIMKNLLDLFISALAYWIIGYAVAYGPGNQFIGLSFWGGVGIPRHMYSHWFFQFIFAATAATIVSGAVAERCHFVAYMVYSAIISGFIYPITAHWVWTQDGWLSKMGYSDFSGSGVVHMLAGACSMVAAILLGPRIGRFEGMEMPGHSIPLIGIGGLIIIAGFLAFNGGSLGNITSFGAGSTTAIVIANTVMGGTGGVGTTLIAGRTGLLGSRSWNFCLCLNGALTGMVSICAAVDKFEFWSSFLVGAIGGFIYIVFHYIIPLWKIDDPLDAVAVHLGGGLWGVLAGPIFKEKGIIFGPNKENLYSLMCNAVGSLAILAWSVLTCLVMFGSLKWCNYLRVLREEELQGLDITKHNEPAYPTAGWSGLIHFPSVDSQDINGTSQSSKVINTQEYVNNLFKPIGMTREDI